MAHALGVDARGPAAATSSTATRPAAFEALVERRLAHEPVAYITGRRAFWTIELEVGPGVLIPRPDSETLIEAAVAHFGEAGPATHPRSRHRPGHAAARRARPMAGRDRARHRRLGGGAGLCPPQRRAARARRRAEFRLGDWGEGLDERFDLDPVQPALCRGRRRPAARGRRAGSPPTRSCRRRRARRLSRARAAARPPARAGRHCLRRDRRRPGGGGARAFAARGLHDRVTKRP